MQLGFPDLHIVASALKMAVSVFDLSIGFGINFFVLLLLAASFNIFAVLFCSICNLDLKEFRKSVNRRSFNGRCKVQKYRHFFQNFNVQHLYDFSTKCHISFKNKIDEVSDFADFFDE